MLQKCLDQIKFNELDNRKQISRILSKCESVWNVSFCELWKRYEDSFKEITKMRLTFKSNYIRYFANDSVTAWANKKNVMNKQRNDLFLLLCFRIRYFFFSSCARIIQPRIHFTILWTHFNVSTSDERQFHFDFTHVIEYMYVRKR